MKLEAVGKRYGARQPWVVRDATAEVPTGQLIRVDGPNGAGKSTLLRVVAGVTMPSRGRVTGRPRVGYVPERFPAGLPFSCRDYLRHMARLHGGGSVDEWLERLGATAFAATPMRTLSKGMTQKVAVTQALLSRPDLVVLDEAWTGLDQAARGALDVAVRERVAEGGTVLFVDYDPARLSGAAGQHWTLDGTASLTITTQPAPPGPTRLIEVSGLPLGVTVPGVISRSAGILRVAATDSDEVLRRLLALDGGRAVQPTAVAPPGDGHPVHHRRRRVRPRGGHLPGQRRAAFLGRGLGGRCALARPADLRRGRRAPGRDLGRFGTSGRLPRRAAQLSDGRDPAAQHEGGVRPLRGLRGRELL